MIYLLCAFCCCLFARRAPRLFWWAIVGILALIGLSSIFNVSQDITSFGRQIALENGFYRGRSRLQSTTIAGVLLISAVIVGSIGTRMRVLRAPEWLALLALGTLINLIIIRAISLHDIDSLFGQRLYGLQFGTLVEAAILLCMSGAALWAGQIRRNQEPAVNSQNT